MAGPAAGHPRRHPHPHRQARGSNNRLHYSGKHHKHGANLQGLIDAEGHLLWVSDGLPGSVHDLTAARTHQVITAITAAEIHTLADKGHQGAGGTITTPIKGKNLTAGQRHVNSLITRRRGPGERAFATLKSWKILTKSAAARTASGR